MCLRSYLEMDISLSGEEAQHYMQKSIVLVCSALDTLRNLIFVGNLFNSLKVRHVNRKYKRTVSLLKDVPNFKFHTMKVNVNCAVFCSQLDSARLDFLISWFPSDGTDHLSLKTHSILIETLICFSNFML